MLKTLICSECGRQDYPVGSKQFPGWCWWCIKAMLEDQPVNSRGLPWRSRAASQEARATARAQRDRDMVFYKTMDGLRVLQQEAIRMIDEMKERLNTIEDALTVLTEHLAGNHSDYKAKDCPGCH